jgi:hypothetical protein
MHIITVDLEVTPMGWAAILSAVWVLLWCYAILLISNLAHVVRKSMRRSHIYGLLLRLVGIPFSYTPSISNYLSRLIFYHNIWSFVLFEKLFVLFLTYFIVKGIQVLHIYTIFNKMNVPTLWTINSAEEVCSIWLSVHSNNTSFFISHLIFYSVFTRRLVFLARKNVQPNLAPLFVLSARQPWTLACCNRIRWNGQIFLWQSS